MIVIEFIGTPGAGKTTLMPTVADFLKERGICGRSVVEAGRPFAQRTLVGKAVSRIAPQSLRQPLLWQVFYYLSALHRLKFFVNHPRLIRQVLCSQRHRPIAVEERHHVLYWFFHLVGYYDFLCAHGSSNEALLLDEGFIHRVVQMNASDAEAPDRAKVLAYVDLLPRPDLVIVPHAAAEVCERRIYRRGVWARFRHKSPDQIARYVANAHCIVDLTVNHIKSSGWSVIEVDNAGDDLALSRSELYGKLRQSPTFAHNVPS